MTHTILARLIGQFSDYIIYDQSDTGQQDVSYLQHLNIDMDDLLVIK